MKICPVCDRTFDETVTSCPDCRATLIRKGGDALLGRAFKDTYVLEERIGAGAMGSVYRATQSPLGRSVAVKVINASQGEDGLIKRFFREAQVMSQLIHPNIVNVIDFGNTEDRLAYMVMEHLQGTTLDVLVDQGRALPVPFVHAAMEQICAGVGAAHGQGMVHRDLKPSNIFIARQSDGSQVVKILDFGLAKVMSTAHSIKLTQQGMLMGTPGYIAPEQISNPANADARSDVYALGAIMVFMLTGQDAYQGATVQLTLAMQIAKPPAKIWIKQLGVPDNLAELIVRVMDPDPDLRLQSCDELVQALRQATGMSMSRLPQVTAGASTKPQKSAEQPSTHDSQNSPQTKLMSEEEIEASLSSDENKAARAVLRPSEADVFLPEDSTKPPQAPKPPAADKGSMMEPLDMESVESEAARVGERVEEQRAEDRPKPETAKPSFLDSLSGSLRDEGDVSVKPDSGAEMTAKRLGGEAPVGQKKKAVDLGAPDRPDTGAVEMPLPTDNLPETAGAAELDQLNPHSSGEVPMIAGLDALADAPLAPSAPTESAATVPALQPDQQVVPAPDETPNEGGDDLVLEGEQPKKVQVSPNQPFKPLELAPDTSAAAKKRSSAKMEAAQAPSAPVAVPADFTEDPRFKMGAAGAGVLLLLGIIWLVLFSGDTGEVKQVDPNKKVAESSRSGAVARSRLYSKQFGPTDLADPEELGTAKAKLTEAAKLMADEKYTAADSAYKEADELFQRAIEAAVKAVTQLKAELASVRAQAEKNKGLCDTYYKNPDLVDREEFRKGSMALDEAARLAKANQLRGAVGAFKKANKLLLSAIDKAQQSLGGLSGEAKEARRRALASRQKFREVYEGTDLDEPPSVRQAKVAMDQAEAYLDETRYDKAKEAYVDAENAYRQAVQQAQDQAHQLKKRYANDEKLAREAYRRCKKLDDSNRLTAPGSWAEGQRELEKAERLAARRQHKAAATAWAEARRKLDRALKDYNVEAREVSSSAGKQARTLRIAAQAKYSPTDVPPPAEFRTGKVSETEAQSYERDELYMDAIVRYEKAAQLFGKVEEEADSIIAKARADAEAAKRQALVKKDIAVKRIRGREPLPKGPDQLVQKGDGELALNRLIASRKTYDEAAEGFVQAKAAFEARLLAKKNAALAIRSKATKAGQDAENLVPGVESAPKQQAVGLISQGDDLFPSEEFDAAGQLFARAEVVYRKAISVAFVKQGSGLLDSGDARSALRSFERAIEQDETNPRGWHYRGWARYQLDENRNAISDFNKALTLDDRFAETYYGRGLAHKDAGDVSQALRDFAKATDLDGNHWQSHLERGKILKAQGRNADAKRALTTAYRLAPGREKNAIWQLLSEIK